MADPNPAAPQSSNDTNELQLVISTLANVVTAINNLTVALKNVFPQQGATATSATAGTASALPGVPAIYMDVVLNGTTYKAALWNV